MTARYFFNKVLPLLGQWQGGKWRTPWDQGKIIRILQPIIFYWSHGVNFAFLNWTSLKHEPHFSLKMQRFFNILGVNYVYFPLHVAFNYKITIFSPCLLILFCSFNVQVELSCCSRSSSNSKYVICLGSYSVWRHWKNTGPGL